MQNRWVRVRRKREANDTLRFVALTSEVGGVVNRGRHNWKNKTHVLSGTDPLHSQPYLLLTSNTSNWKRQLICLFLFSNFSSVSLHSSRIHAMHESLHYVCIHNWFKIQHLPFCEISNLASIFGITYLKSNYLCSFWGYKCKCDNPYLGLAATYILSVLNKSWFCWFLGLLYIYLWFSQAFPYLRLLNIMIDIFKSFSIDLLCLR